MQNRLTIKDIARLSGVGKSTVSRVLNNEGSVSPQTRERVEAVIRQQGFTPSKSARAMRGQSDKVVGIIVSRLDSPSENQAVRTMLRAKGNSIDGGTSEVNLNVVSKRVLGLLDHQ